MSAQIPNTEPTPDRILRLAEVLARVGLSRSSLYRRMASGDFPSSVNLGAKAVGWKLSDIDAWFASRKAVQS